MLAELSERIKEIEDTNNSELRGLREAYANEKTRNKHEKGFLKFLCIILVIIYTIIYYILYFLFG